MFQVIRPHSRAVVIVMVELNSRLVGPRHYRQVAFPRVGSSYMKRTCTVSDLGRVMISDGNSYQKVCVVRVLHVGVHLGRRNS